MFEKINRFLRNEKTTRIETKRTIIDSASDPVYNYYINKFGQFFIIDPTGTLVGSVNSIG